MSDNPIFRYHSTLEELFAQARLDRETVARYGPIIHALDERDRLLEDFVSEGMRRDRTNLAVGDGTAHTGTTAWMTFVPQLTLVFPKALLRSHLSVTVAVEGQTENAAGGWVRVGCRLLDAQGNIVAAEVEGGRFPFLPAQDGLPTTIVGQLMIGSGVQGAVTLQTRVSVDSAGTSWVSNSQGVSNIRAAESL